MSTRGLLTACLLSLSGCATLYSKIVHFDRLTDCPDYTAEALIAQQQEFGPLSETRTLECALNFIRTSQALPLQRGTLGSHLCLHLAERNPDPNQREKLAAEGVRFAETALALGAGEAGGVHYYLATNLGLAVRDHLTLAAENLTRLESELQRAVALNPDIDDGGPLRVLGFLYLKAPPWPAGIGDGDKALALLQQAVESHPGHPLNHLFYAQALLDAGNDADAKLAKAEFARGRTLLREGSWGYNKAPWDKEFAAFAPELGE